MTYEELKAAYEAAMQKCSELEKENDELKKSNEDQALHIEHLEEQILKRNKMLFGQKSEKSNTAAEMNCAVILKRKRSCIRSPKIRENVRSAAVSSCRFQKNTSPHGSALSLRRSLRSHTFVRSTNVNIAISTEIRRIL